MTKTWQILTWQEIEQAVEKRNVSLLTESLKPAEMELKDVREIIRNSQDQGLPIERYREKALLDNYVKSLKRAIRQAQSQKEVI